jgi:hypothetical protein
MTAAPLTPNSEVTLLISEAAVRAVLDAYQRARPEEFRLVTAHYSDGDPDSTPINLNDDGVWLDYAIRILNIVVDMPPATAGLRNPIPPSNGRLAIGASPSFEFRNFSDSSAVFKFAISLWVLAQPRLVMSNGAAFVTMDLLDLRLSGLGPDQLQDFFQYVLSLIVRQLLGRIRIPTTFNLADTLTLMMLGDLDVQQKSIEVYAAIYRPGPAS